MNRKITFCFVIGALLFLPQQIVATDVGGLINSNTTWNLAGSPYVVTSSVLVNTGVTLTIDAGVEVQFDADLSITIDGTLIARGTSGSEIVFTSSKTTKAPGDWNGIIFSNSSIDAVLSGGVYQSGSILEYCIIEYAGPAIKLNDASPLVDHCVIFKNSTNGSEESSGIELSSCTSPIIRNSFFISNFCRNIGRAGSAIEMMSCTDMEIINNIFYNNYAQVYNGGSAQAGTINLNNAGSGQYLIAYNTFYQNTCDGYEDSQYPQQIGGAFSATNLSGDNVTFEYNTVMDNVATESQNPGAIVASHISVNNNNIFENEPFDVAINTNLDKTAGYELDATGNWWGTDTESDIQDQIHDFYDDFDENEVYYSPWSSEPLGAAPVSPPRQVIKQAKTGGTYVRWRPNPETDVAGYRIYYGSPTGYSYANSVDAGNDTVYLLAGATVYDEIAVTAYDATADGNDDMVQGHESWYAIADLGVSLSYIPTHVSCKGYSNGAVDLIVSNGFPPYTYDWSNDSTTEDLTGLTAGTYEVTVTDIQGFIAEGTIVVTEPDTLESSFSVTNVNCIGGSDGEVDITVVGGTPEYGYSWTGPGSYNSSQEDLTGLTEGKYYLSLTDSKGCLYEDSITLTYDHELPVPVISYADSNKICDGDSIILDAGPGYSSYEWSTTAITQAITVYESATYSVTVTDDNGCINSDDETVTVLPVPTSSFSLDDSICADEANLITYTGTGLVDAIYKWETDGGNIISGSGQGPISVEWPSTGLITVSLSLTQNGCQSDTTRVPFEIFQVPTSLFAMQSAICADGSVPVTYTGNASAIADYNWSLDGGTVQSGSGQGPLEISWPAGGDKTVSLQVSENGCISPITDHILYVAYPFENEEICMVTIDTATGKNMVIWENTLGMGTESYNVYRESNVAGVYNLLGNVPATENSLFIDMDAVPEKQQYLYKITVLDSCGNESEKSQYHKTLFLQYTGSDVGVNLSWKLYQIEGTPITFDSYILYKGTDSSALEPFDTISGGLDAYTDLDPASLTIRYYYRIAGVRSEECDASGGTKAGAGPYSHSISNLEDNRLQTSVSNEPERDAVQVFPNPFSETTTILFPNPSGSIYRVYIMDLYGKVVKTDQFSENKFILQRGNLESGYYILDIRGDESYKIKLIIE